jgi:hypothetical protein
MEAPDPARTPASLHPVAVVAWKALSYFAADAARQREGIGPAGEWFVRERRDRPHANYLIGMAVVLMEHAGGLAVEFAAPASCLRELAQRFNRQVADHAWLGWNADALADEALWGDTRRLARAGLQELGLHENFPRKPLVIEDLVAIDMAWPGMSEGRDR